MYSILGDHFLLSLVSQDDHHLGHCALRWVCAVDGDLQVWSGTVQGGVCSVQYRRSGFRRRNLLQSVSFENSRTALVFGIQRMLDQSQH